MAVFLRLFAKKVTAKICPVQPMVRHYSPQPLTFMPVSQIIWHLEQVKIRVSSSLIVPLLLSQSLHVGQRVK